MVKLALEDLLPAEDAVHGFRFLGLPFGQPPRRAFSLEDFRFANDVSPPKAAAANPGAI
jgi:hypothetical protein